MECILGFQTRGCVCSRLRRGRTTQMKRRVVASRGTRGTSLRAVLSTRQAQLVIRWPVGVLHGWSRLADEGRARTLLSVQAGCLMIFWEVMRTPWYPTKANLELEGPTPRVSSSRLCFVKVPCACTDSTQATTLTGRTQERNSGMERQYICIGILPCTPILVGTRDHPCPGLQGHADERNNTTRAYISKARRLQCRSRVRTPSSTPRPRCRSSTPFPSPSSRYQQSLSPCACTPAMWL